MPGRKELALRMGRDSYAELTGLEVLRAEPGYVEVRLKVTPAILNGHGNVHGGALFTLADYASAAASNMYGAPTIAVDGSISYLQAVREGEVVAKARTVRRGRRMTFQVVELFRGDGELAAIFQGGAIVVEKRQTPPSS